MLIAPAAAPSIAPDVVARSARPPHATRAPRFDVPLPGIEHMPAPHAPALTPEAEALRSKWLAAGAARAGIDLAAWKPEKGYAANVETVLAVPRYYANLWLDHPEFEWPLMGTLVAAQFVAGMQDAAEMGRSLRRPNEFLAGLKGPVGDAVRGAVKLSGIGGLTRIEPRLLSMQQQIFFDMALMHEAYLADGLPAIRELRRHELIDDLAERTWEKIDTGRRTGDRTLLHEGAAGLAWREQMQIIADDYDEMRHDGAGGRLLTYALTSVGRVTIPGAKSPTEFAPVRIGPITLPLPAMDISRREHRWNIMERDTFAAMFRLVDTNPALAQRLARTDIQQRIRDEKLRRGNGIPGLGLAG